MANKQSIQDIDAALDRWHRKLNTAVGKIDFIAIRDGCAATSLFGQCMTGFATL